MRQPCIYELIESHMWNDKTLMSQQKGLKYEIHDSIRCVQNTFSRRKRKNAAQNFSLISKIALAQIKNSQRKGSFKMKRKLAGWDENYMIELLDSSWMQNLNS